MIKLFLLSYLVNCNALNLSPININLSRRSILSTTILPSFDSLKNDIINIKKEIDNNIKKDINETIKDPYAFWAYGVVPPPIERVVSYNELIREIQNNNIMSVEIAVQHDCVIATTIKGHRISCLIPDKEFDNLLNDSRDKNGDLLVNVLETSPFKRKIRNTAQFILGSSLFLFIGSELDIIPIDFIAFNSLEEREKFYKNNEKPKKIIKSFIDKFLKDKQE